jgi:hypothetical protein
MVPLLQSRQLPAMLTHHCLELADDGKPASALSLVTGLSFYARRTRQDRGVRSGTAKIRQGAVP